MPEIIIAEINEQNHNVEVTELIVVYVGMENKASSGGGTTLTPEWFDEHYRVQVTVQGDIDGANTAFTLPDADAIVSTVKLNYGGALIRGVDFSIDVDGNITMLFIPEDTTVPFLAEYFFGL